MCDTEGAPPPGSNPDKASEQFCVFNAEIARIAIEANGDVLAEWKATGSKDEAASANADAEPVHLGVHFAALDARTLAVLHMTEDHGLIVAAVDDNSPAARAGIQKADVILSFAHRSMTSIADLQSAVKSVSAGTLVPVRVWRGGQEIDVNVQF